MLLYAINEPGSGSDSIMYNKFFTSKYDADGMARGLYNNLSWFERKILRHKYKVTAVTVPVTSDYVKKSTFSFNETREKLPYRQVFVGDKFKHLETDQIFVIYVNVKYPTSFNIILVDVNTGISFDGGGVSIIGDNTAAAISPIHLYSLFCQRSDEFKRMRRPARKKGPVEIRSDCNSSEEGEDQCVETSC